MAMRKRGKQVAENASAEVVLGEATSLSARSKALVFISHDSRDADIAEAFSNLLSDVSAGMLKSFRSSDKTGTSGIPFGEEWYTAIMSKLDDATDVVALLTPDSIERPWILYEAGVAKGKLDIKVLGIALGIPLERVTTSGPFGQFQNSDGTEKSLTGLVMQLVKRNPDADPREEAIRVQVRAFLEKLKELLSNRGKRKENLPAIGEEQTAAKLFEEIKAMVRELPDRVDERVRATSKRGPLRRLRRFHPKMIDELLFHPEFRDSGDVATANLLVILSLLRDDAPWIYEVGLEYYRALRKGDPDAIEDAQRQFRMIVEATAHGPFLQEMMMRPDDDSSYILMRYLPEMLQRFDRGPILKRAPGRLNPLLTKETDQTATKDDGNTR